MATIKDKSAREKIVRARTNLLVSNGFFGFLALQLKLVEDNESPTAWVNGISMGYNPKFIHSLSERETEGVIAHELMHCCFQHFTRRGTRDPMGWNIAGDFVINLDLTESGFTLPKSALLDKQYKGMTTEEVYERLPKMTIKVSGGDGKGDGKNNPDPGGCGGVRDAPGDAGKKADVQHTWETAVRTAVAVAKANNAGNLPGSIKRLIDQLSQPKVSWRDLTRRFIDQSMTKDVSWSRISRRSTSIGTLMPGYISDRLNHLIMIADTSGSVSQKMLNEFISEVAGALDEGTADRITVLYADTRVHDVDEFVAGDFVTARTLDKGGGGTAFSDSFRWVRENAPEASAIIYLTDLCVYDFGEDPNIPTLWAVYGPAQNYPMLAEKAPFGECLHVSNSYS